uniref:Uncharacterized protein n=1 Tax=Micrurus paraensis TaxID=1970185 RepID=A0A2D4KMQ0_9SAUR
MSEGKYNQATEKYLRSERHLKSLGRHRPRLATLVTTKGPNKTILVKHSEDDETSRSLLQSRPKMPSRNLLCQSESKFFPKRCKSDRPSVQDLPNTTEGISFHA